MKNGCHCGLDPQSMQPKVMDTGSWPGMTARYDNFVLHINLKR